jgi:hypothetical protein
MTAVSVIVSQALLDHLQTWDHDGATVSSALFGDGRLVYPGRDHVEHQMGAPDPYTLAHEARVIVGLGARAEAAIRLLAWEANRRHSNDDPTLELLWLSHESARSLEGPSPDRLVAALVSVQELSSGAWWDPEAGVAAQVLVEELTRLGFPPSHEGLEELFDGAEPACVGLGLVQL